MKVFFRTAALLSTLSVPFIATGCSKEDNTTVVKNVKSQELLNAERQQLERTEKKLVAHLFAWASQLTDIGFELDIITPKNNTEGLKQNAVYLDLCFRTQGFRNISGSKFITTKPDNTTLDIFNRMIKAGEKFAPYTKKYLAMSNEEFALSIEKAIKSTPDITKDEIEDWKNIAVERLKKYKESISKVSEAKENFRKDLTIFNKDAQLSELALYEPSYGLTLERLKSITDIEGITK